MPRLSAGRVQSVATRLVVERERERMAFRPASYWDLEAVFGSRRDGAEPADFGAALIALDGRRVAQGRDFSPAAELKTADAVHLGEADAGALAGRLDGVPFSVKSVERKPYRRSPYAPFRTTTLQQEASRKLGFSAKYTMSVAQRLYENGHITYMRTDSITLSETAIAAARGQAKDLFGAEYVSEVPRRYTSKVKNAQEAHEAIRPAGDEFATPSASGLTGDESRLYELIWKRTVASQMKDATGESVSVRVVGRSSAGEDAEFGASGKVINFYGFLKAYVEDADDPDTEREDAQRRLPPLAADELVNVISLDPAGHTTRPPARYTEATLVKELEDREIGRPSTYASIIGTILDRGYVFRKGTALVPSFLAFAVVTLLERHFGHLVDYDFTARMEDVLDQIARGEAARVPWLRRFYFGENGDEGLKELVSDLGDIDARDVSSIPVPGTSIVAKVGRYGPYVTEVLDSRDATGGDGPAGAAKAASAARSARNAKQGTKQQTAKQATKPRAASLLKTMTLATVTLDDALRLLTLPRVLGVLDDEEVTVQNGRYGPYVKKGSDSRSLESEETLFTLTLAEAKELFSQPKSRGRGTRAAAAPALRELGDDPGTGKPIVIKSGRFGPYVTDGETNASLRKGDDVESVTLRRAAELLAERRAAGPGQRRGRSRASTRA